MLFSACSSPTQKAAEATLRQAHIDPATAAIVSGRVDLIGAAPKPRKLDLSANPTCERQHARPVYSEDVVVGKSGGLRNTLVRVVSGLPVAHWAVPEVNVALNQDGCIYQPHVLAFMTGQTLEVSNSDPLNHNVHAESKVNASFNVAQPPRAEKLFRKFDQEEIMIPVSCGVHPWMKAYVSALSHPFFAVSGEDGAFELPALPAGTYILEALHEIYGPQRMTVQVAAQQRKSVNFRYQSGSR